MQQNKNHLDYLNHSLNILIEEYSHELTKAQYNQYATKLKRFFIPYILIKYGDIKEISKIFSDEFSQSDIINATVYYMENDENVESKASFYSEIDKKLVEDGFNFKDATTNPAINQDQCNYIFDFLNSYNKNTTKAKELKIVLKLFLLYGLGNNVIENLTRDNIDLNRGTLKIKYRNLHFIELELPYSLFNEIKQYLASRKDSNPLLFITEAGNKIQSGFYNHIFKDLKLNYESTISPDENFNESNPFTPTGLQKYAITKMLLEGMSRSVISELTGQEQTICDDCEEQINLDREFNINRYVNHMLRGIETYDLM